MGLCISIFSFCGAMTGAIASTVLGKLNDHYTKGITEDREKGVIAGKLLTIVVAVSYIGCAVPFFIAAFMYKRFIYEKK